MRHLRLSRAGAIAATGLWLGSCGGDSLPDPSFEPLSSIELEQLSQAADVSPDEAQLEPALDLERGLALGGRGVVRGTVVKLDRNSLRGDGLELSRPLLVAGQPVRLIGLAHPRGFTPGNQVELWGRLYENRESVGFARVHFALDGISNLSAGEPRFDGDRFRDRALRPLITLSWDTSPVAWDEPGTIAVRNPEKGVAHFARFGGFLPPSASGSPFFGFYATSVIATPTALDREAVVFDMDGTPMNKAGHALESIGVDPDPPRQTDWMLRTWWLDRSAAKIYRLDYGGLGGLHGLMVEVIRVPAGG